jgi:hypothetical protein
MARRGADQLPRCTPDRRRFLCDCQNKCIRHARVRAHTHLGLAAVAGGDEDDLGEAVSLRVIDARRIRPVALRRKGTLLVKTCSLASIHATMPQHPICTHLVHPGDQLARRLVDVALVALAKRIQVVRKACVCNETSLHINSGPPLHPPAGTRRARDTARSPAPCTCAQPGLRRQGRRFHMRSSLPEPRPNLPHTVQCPSVPTP